MLFFLRKLAEALALPLGVCGLLVVAAVITRRRVVALIAVLLLYVCAIHFTAELLVLPLERDYPSRSAASCPPADAIVTLSGGIVRGIGASGVQWGEAAGRYLGALSLAKAGRANLLIFTGAHLNHASGLTEGSVLRIAAIHDGIPPDRIRVTPAVWTTAEEAREVSRMPDVHSILLVTSAFHMPRAAMLFRARGLRVIPFPTDQWLTGGLGTEAVDFLPTAAALHESDVVLREYYGLAAYRILLAFGGHGAAR